MKGIIRSQGSLIAENLYERKIDFASEWKVDEDKNVLFLGLSLFHSSNRGKYQGNLLESQSDIENLLRKNSKWNSSYLHIQQDFIKKYISPIYSGPVGFDMLADKDGEINPCVEINIRRTMGHVAIEVEKMLREESDSNTKKIIHEYFPDNVFSIKRLVNEN
ncbi:MAG: hypothetical protein K2H18_00800 [Muribaculaceae bacterium]|nr:hypothetical protein [Muribaculaceae bacterium]